MRPPVDYTAQNERENEWKLNKIMYELKQVVSSEYIKIGDSFKNSGFLDTPTISYLFKWSKGDDTILVNIGIDDLLLGGKEENIKEHIRREYEFIKLWAVKYYLFINK